MKRRLGANAQGDPAAPVPVWIAVTATADPACEEPVGAILNDTYGGGLLVETRGGRSALTVYIPEREWTPASETLLRRRLAALAGPFPGFAFDLATASLPAENWAEAWKVHFKPLRLGRRVLIVPSWERPERKPGDLLVRLDPGAAFGTGLHETTRLCVEALEREIDRPGLTVLDLGCGTGLLAIVAAKLGATAVATDIDPFAVEIAGENARKNRVGRRIETLEADLLAGNAAVRLAGRTFDVVVANILLPEVLRLLRGVRPFLRPGGRLLLSGLLATQVGEVREEMEREGLPALETQELREWALVVGHRRGPDE